MMTMDDGRAHTWHAQPTGEVCAALAVDGARGLTGQEAAARRERQGENRLVDRPAEPGWRKLLRILRDPLTIVLILAALVSAAVTREWETPLVILVVVVLNAALNLIQERRAEHSLKALQDLTVTRARVRRDGRMVVIDASELVTGDVVSLEAGDVVPADGRLIEATTLEVQEAALTGESLPSSKSASAQVAPDAGIGDRANMVFMTTAVTRGRASFVVTQTGMNTEIGRIADLLNSTERDKTPLQRQIDGLAQLLTWIAMVVVCVVFGLGLLRGRAVTELFLTAVSLAVATIPEGLSAVVAFTLAMGAARLAKHGAIVKNLAAVETLGSTSHICTDKTGTLTLNQMTARKLFSQQRLFEVSGDGYSTEGEIMATQLGSDNRPLPEPVPPVPDLREALLAMALCADAALNQGELVGDPTEGALVVLAEKGGLDVELVRDLWPREAEIPFDSERKYMATFHRFARVSQLDPGDPHARWAEGLAPADKRGVRLLLKGAPDVVLALCSELVTPEGVVPLSEHHQRRLAQLIQDIGSEGLRVMAIAQRDLADDAFGQAEREDPARLHRHVGALRLLALVAIEDPPRREAREAIAAAHEAGITLHMITGDHVGTASAIAEKLGIGGDALSGAELDAMDDAALAARAHRIGVLARVSPSHKIRTVRALQSGGAVVAMTGDGVNDAPALKQADIGVAMGITGTEVSKGAASMILTDDNFATIVAAIRQGRGIYGNIVKFVKFQLATAWAFVLIFLVTAVFDVGHAAPFSALQILWVNIIMDGPPALALGVDPTPASAMKRPPRPPRQRLLNGALIARILTVSVIMAAGTLGVLLYAAAQQPSSAGVAGTMAFTTLVFFQVFNLLNVHVDENTVFSRYVLTNGWIWVALVGIVVLQGLVVHVGFLQQFFTTRPLQPSQWLLCLAVGSSVLWLEELRKLGALVLRRGAAR
jgi:P-type Ca2+ transporter type 2C